MRDAADELRLSEQTVKNHLTAVYAALGVRSGAQAIYVLMGGDDVAASLPPPREERRPSPPRRATVPSARDRKRLRKRIDSLANQVSSLLADKRRLQRELAAAKAPRKPAIALPADMPAMHDGAIRLKDLERAARLLDSDTVPGESPKATLTEWVEVLAYYVRPRGTREAASA